MEVHFTRSKKLVSNTLPRIKFIAGAFLQDALRTSPYLNFGCESVFTINPHTACFDLILIYLVPYLTEHKERKDFSDLKPSDRYERSILSKIWFTLSAISLSLSFIEVSC